MRRVGMVMASVALVAAGAACSDDPGEGSTTTQPPPVDPPAGPVAGAEWEKVVPGGDCQCSDGSEFNFWVREADPAKVVVFLQGGGACFTAETCDPANELYRFAVEGAPHPEGMFDLGDERNPFADHSIVYVPYCTGDVHLGNTTQDYGEGLTIQHRGYANGTAALDYVATTFPDAREVVVVGESAGAVAAPVYGALVGDRLPEAAVRVLADGSGAYPDDPAIDEILATWRVADVLPDWFDPAALSFPGLVVEAGRHDPDMVLARHDFAYDEDQTGWFPFLGLEVGDLQQRIDANEATIEGTGARVHSYTSPGSEHTIVGDAELYTQEVEGQRLVDWVAGVIAGEDVADVHCRECQQG